MGITQAFLKELIGLPDPTLPFLASLTTTPLEELKRRVVRGNVGTVHCSGTTIVALSYRRGVVMAADRQTTSGWRKSSETIKVKQISNYSLYGAAGMVAYIQELQQVFTSLLKHLSHVLETEIYIDGQAKLMEYLLKQNFLGNALLNEILGYIAMPILAGWDPEKNKPHIFSYDGAGAIFEATAQVRQYTSVGSGSDIAHTVLDDQWEEGMDEKSAAKLAVRAVYRAGDCDIGSSPGQLYPITVLFAREAGFGFLSEQQALGLAHAIFDKDMRRRGDPMQNVFLSSPPPKKRVT